MTDMQNDIDFNFKGARTLALVVLSCFPVHHELSPIAKAYLRKVIAGEEILSVGVLLGKLPELKKSLIEFAKHRGCNEIFEEEVASFFAGKFHYEKIIQEFEDKKLHIVPGSIYSLKTMFAHLIVPIQIIGLEEDGFVGKYSKGKFSFVVRGLVTSNNDKDRIKNLFEKKIQVIALIHFATVILVNPSEAFMRSILGMIDQLDFFRASCEYLQKTGGADYNVFPRDCREETENVFRNLNL